MTTPSNGPITLTNLVDEWGDLDGTPTDLSEYYAGGDNVGVGAGGINGDIPASGELKFSQFLGASDAGVTAPFWSFTGVPEAVYFSPPGVKISQEVAMHEGGNILMSLTESQTYKRVWPIATSYTDPEFKYSNTGTGSASLLGKSHTVFHAGLLYVFRADRDNSKCFISSFVADNIAERTETGVDTSTWGMRTCSSDETGDNNSVVRACISELGKIYLYDLDDFDTTPTITLNTTFTENTANALIGWSLSMDATGETLVASLEDGTIKTYTRSGATWSAGVVGDLDATTHLDEPTTDALVSDAFSVKLSGDGNWLLVGDPGSLSADTYNRAAIYERVANTWTHRKSFNSTDGLSQTLRQNSTPNAYFDYDQEEIYTRNDWLDIDYTGSRIVIGEWAYSTAAGRVLVIDRLSSNWSSIEVNQLDPPAEADHPDSTFQANAPWADYFFGAHLRLQKSGCLLSCVYYPDDHSGPSTNETYVHVVAYALSRPTLSKLPLVAFVESTEYFLAKQFVYPSNLILIHRGILVDEIVFDSSTTELSVMTRRPFSDGSDPPLDFFSSIKLEGDWGSGNETKTFFTADATRTLESTFYWKWTWSVTASEQFVDTNTYEVTMI